MLIKTDDNVVIDIEEAYDYGSIVETDDNHYTIVYWFDAGIECMKTVATYKTRHDAFKALEKLEETGELLSDGRTTLVKEDEIMRRLVVNLFSKHNKPLRDVQILPSEDD